MSTTYVAKMRGLLYVRAVETDDGSWSCRVGLTEFDQHGRLPDALLHLKAIGTREAAGRPFEIVMHPLVGAPQFLRGDAIADLGT
jgi:hypothetical protein